jgi:hypothetical protein
MSRQFNESVKLSTRFLQDPVGVALEYLLQESSKNKPVIANRGFKMALRYCRDLQKEGAHWLGYAQDVEESLDEAGSDFSGDFLETLERIMATPPPPTLQTAIVEYIRNEYAGLIEFDQATGSVLVTTRGELQGISQFTFWGDIWNRILDNVPGADNRTSPQHEVKTLIKLSAQKYLKAKGAKEELRDAFKAHKRDLPALSSLQGADVPLRIDRASEGPWGEIKALMTPFWDAYGVKDERSREGLFRFIVGLATLSMEPGRSCQWALFLSGAGGCGKTSFGKTLALTLAPSSDLTKDSLEPKKIIEVFQRASIGIIDEIDTWRKSNEKLKSILSASVFEARLAYAEQVIRVPRSWMWLATSNQSTMADDGAGLRRYFPVKLSGGIKEGQERLEFLTGYRELLWAIGYQSYLAGYPVELDAELVRENAETSFKEESDIKDLMRQFAQEIASCVSTDSSRIDRLNISAMIEILGQSYSSRAYADVRDVLEELKWECKTIRDTRGKAYPRSWVPPGLGSEFEVVSQPHPDALAVIRRTLSKS